VQRRTFIKASAATALIAPEWRALTRGQPNGQPANDCCTAFVWQTMVPTPANAPALNGHTDTIPDIVGRKCSNSLLFGGWRGFGVAAAVLYSPISALNILADL
jgi:hypothetical protein